MNTEFDALMTKSEKSDRNTILHILVKNNDDTLSKYISHKIIKDMKNQLNKYKKTPLHLAIEKKLSLAIIIQLITKTNINMQDNQGNTPLHHAYQNDLSSTDTIDLLIANGANVEIKNKQGLIPVLVSRSGIARRQSIFNHISKDNIMDILKSIQYYKGENGAKRINGYLNKHRGVIPNDISTKDTAVVRHIKNLRKVMKTGNNDTRYNKTFYRGVRQEQVVLLKQKYTNKKSDKTIKSYHFSSITPKKSVARQFTNIQYGHGDDTCCIMYFKIPDEIKRIDMRKLEDQGFLVNPTEREILLEPKLNWKIERKSGDVFKMKITKMD